MNSVMNEGELWYILDRIWWNKWTSFVNYDEDESAHLSLVAPEYPSKVDNSNIICNKSLKPNLLVDRDVIFVPEAVWEMFSNSFGCLHTNTSLFQRHSLKLPNGSCDLDLYPPHFIFKSRNGYTYFEQTFTKAHTILHLEHTFKQRVKCMPNLRLQFLTTKNEVIEEELDTTISEASLESEKVLMVQFHNGRAWVDDLKLIDSSSITTRNSGSFDSSSSDSNSRSIFNPSAVKGLCGLSNLGNTCFMNSAIQCMSNVPQLTEYFIGSLDDSSKRSRRWEKELNKTNPLGMKGRIATAYADLISKMWLESSTVQMPRSFKAEVSKYAPQFSGYAQHDSQELMMFVLDGLHEDLNRILKKPYIEAKDADGRPDPEVAEEAWNMHKARNDSIIVDLFHGQLKSTVVCPSCNFVSVTFDPYASLSLPLLEPTRYVIKCLLWPYERPSLEQHPDWQPGILLSYVLKFDCKPSASMLSSALEACRPLSPGLKENLLREPFFDAPVQVSWSRSALAETCGSSSLRLPRPGYLDWRSRVSRGCEPVSGVVDELRKFEKDCWLVAYELSEGTPYPVRFVETKSSSMRFLGLPCYINLKGTTGRSRPSMDDVAIRAHIDMRLHALGLIPPDALSSQGESMDEDTSEAKIDRTSEHLYSISRTSQGYYSQTYCDVTVIDERLAEKIKLLHPNNALASNEEALTFDQSFKTEAWDLKLDHCLKRFTEQEKLGENDLWYCTKCKSEQQATKKFDLWTLPKVLVVHLKRFRSEYRHHDKMSTHVDFPLDGLDMTDWVKTRKSGERYLYDLVAVSNHMGYLGGGHYTAYAKNAPTNRWYQFDDSHVSPVDTKRIVSAAAYVLVYVRREVDSNSRNGNLVDCNGDDLNVEVEPMNFSPKNRVPGFGQKVEDTDDMMGV
ncbi:Ubiquitin carboxyl-terminal hydrolase 15, partial [Cichlidogyrus casuarinus]